MTKHAVYVRKQIEINTDPQRRCYNGCHFSSEMHWTDWAHICTYSTQQDADETAALFKSINPSREYKVETLEVDS